MPLPVTNLSASTVVAEIPVAAIDDGIASNAATDCDPHTPLPSIIKSGDSSHQNPTPLSRLFPSRAQHKKFVSYVIIICILSNFLVEVGDFLMRAPFIRLLEAILCRQYWQEHDPGRFPGKIEEKWCKVATIQAELSMLRGWDLLFSCLPTILLTIPMGIVADRYGRKMLLFLALSGLTLATAWMQIVVYFNHVFNVKWFWAGNAFLLIGGGPAVINNMFFIILADVTSEEERVTTFFRFMATNLAGTVLAVPLAWYFVKFSLWLPMLLGFGCILSGTLLTLLIPETLDRQKEDDPASEPLLDRHNDDNDRAEPAHKALHKTRITLVVQFLYQLKFVFASPLLAILAVTFFANSLGQSVLMLLLQFASNRFAMTISSASLLIPFSAALNFAVLVFILPWINSRPASNDSHDAAARDLTIARASIILLVLGLVGIALSPHIAVLVLAITVYALGAGYSGASRSLVTSFVERDQVGRLYAVLAMLDTAGTVVSGPTLSKIFSWGLALGGLWSGIPFFFAAALFGLVGVVIWVIHLPEKGGGEGETETEE